jgi:hypothetical protein
VGAGPDLGTSCWSQAIAAGKNVSLRRVITFTVAKAPPLPPCAPVKDNPWGYCFEVGSLIHNAPPDFCVHFPCIASFWDGRGHVMQCEDGEFSHSGGIRGSCSHHAGNYRPFLDP